jgi:4-diphosphocytidyl-2-C-methyl-D-erythritol kinase
MESIINNMKKNIPNQITVLSPAKLNLFLQIVGKRQDGYHNLQTVFQLLDFGDKMSFKLNNNSGQITLRCNNTDLQYQDNIIYKAVAELNKVAKSNFGCDIYLEKSIPIGGGMGGGSSNAATTLLVLNKLWQLNLSYDTLLNIGSNLGADVPIFINGNNCFAEGIGEQLTPIELPEYWYLIVAPNIQLNTAKMFASDYLIKNSTPVDASTAIKSNKNCFELAVKKSSIIIEQEIKLLNEASKNSITPATITGSGACFFTTFKTQSNAESARSYFINHKTSNSYCIIAKGCNKSLLHQEYIRLKN